MTEDALKRAPSKNKVYYYCEGPIGCDCDWCNMPKPIKLYDEGCPKKGPDPKYNVEIDPDDYVYEDPDFIPLPRLCYHVPFYLDDSYFFEGLSYYYGYLYLSTEIVRHDLFGTFKFLGICKLSKDSKEYVCFFLNDDKPYWNNPVDDRLDNDYQFIELEEYCDFIPLSDPNFTKKEQGTKIRSKILHI